MSREPMHSVDTLGADPSGDCVWVKGNLHCHTANGDGDAPPEEVAKWYKDHGYHFLVLSDHNMITRVEELNARFGGDFLLIPGSELNVRGCEKELHASALGMREIIAQPEPLDTVARSLSSMVELIRETGSVVMVNHPNFCWAFGHGELLPLRDPYLLEVFNGHPLVNNFGNTAFLPVEQTWDILLSSGKTVYATATDDAHNYGEFAPHMANPGRGWVYVEVRDLTPEAVLKSLRAGGFYASTGVELAQCKVHGGQLHVRVNPKPNTTHTIRFIGDWGRILSETPGTSASHTVKADGASHTYVRCKVIANDATAAWTQAFPTEKGS